MLWTDVVDFNYYSSSSPDMSILTASWAMANNEEKIHFNDRMFALQFY